MANYTFPQWLLYGSGWTIGYAGTGKISTTRDTGSDYLTISASMAIYSTGGDTAGWTFHCAYKNSSGNWVQIMSSAFSGGTYHSQWTTYNASGTYNLPVSATAGSVDLRIWMSIDGYESYTGGSCNPQGGTFSYSSKGESTITGDSAATISPTGSSFKIKWTPNASTFRFWYRITVGSINVDSPWIYPQTTSQYTCTVSLSAEDSQKFIKAINTSASANATITLYTCTSSSSKEIGTSSYTCKFTVSADVKPAITGLALSGQDSTFNVFITGSEVIITATVSQAYSAAINTVYAVVNGTTYYGTYVSATSWKITFTGGFSPSSSCVNYTANVYITDVRGRSNSIQTSFNVYRYTVPSITLTGHSTATTGTFELGMVWSCTNITGNTGTATLTRDITTVWTGSGLVGNTSYTDAVPSATTTYTYTLTVSDLKSTITKTWVTGITTMSALRGGQGVRFFGEAQAVDASKVVLFSHSGESTGFRLVQEKNNNKSVSTYLSSNIDPNTCVRGLWDDSTDSSGVAANWWCWISDEGNINISNSANASNRGIYLNSNSVYAKINGTDKRIADWVTTDSTIGGWRVRKTALGIWDCYKDISVTGTISTAWGNVYYLELPSTTWPATVSSVDQILSCTLTRIGSAKGWVWVGEAEPVSTTHTQVWELYRPAADTTSKTYTFRVHAVLDFSGN